MGKIINTLIFFVLLIVCTNNIIGQSNKKDSTKYRNPFYSEKIVPSLNFSPIINSYQYQLNKYSEFNRSSIKGENNISLPLGMLSSFYLQKKNLNKALLLQRKWTLEEQDLGIFGEVLQYVNAAATGYLLYEHFRKYKDKYK